MQKEKQKKKNEEKNLKNSKIWFISDSAYTFFIAFFF